MNTEQELSMQYIIEENIELTNLLVKVHTKITNMKNKLIGEGNNISDINTEIEKKDLDLLTYLNFNMQNQTNLVMSIENLINSIAKKML